MVLDSNNNRLPKSIVIRRQTEIELLFKVGKSDRLRHITLVYKKSDSEQVGFFVGKRCGAAHERIKIKRWLREIYRTHKDKFINYTILFVCKKPMTCTFFELQDSILKKELL
jgi:ribonuclease P protein component